MVRRLKADVLDQLPTKRRQRILLTLNGSKGSAAATELANLDKAMASMPASDERGRQHLLSQMCVALGAAKAQAAADFVLEMLPSCERLLFFAHHKSMLDAVGAAAASAGVRTFRIDGAVPAIERASLVNSFQALPPGKPAIFLLSILAAGQGLTLTAACTAVFGELRWTPGELLQAEDRCHRIGQRSAVNVYYLVARDTADEAMWAVLQRKVRSLGAALDGQRKLKLSVAEESERTVAIGDADQQDLTNPLPAGIEGANDSSSEALGLLARKAERERLLKRVRCPPDRPAVRVCG